MLIFASDVRGLNTKEIPVVKVKWRHCPLDKDTWEIESEMHTYYPHFFETLGTS